MISEEEQQQWHRAAANAVARQATRLAEAAGLDLDSMSPDMHQALRQVARLCSTPATDTLVQLLHQLRTGGRCEHCNYINGHWQYCRDRDKVQLLVSTQLWDGETAEEYRDHVAGRMTHECEVTIVEGTPRS